MQIIPVVIIVLKKGNWYILITTSTKFNGRAFPGGKIRFGETIREATIREAKEELGIDVVFNDIIGFGEVITNGYVADYTFQKDNTKKHYLFYTALCSKKYNNNTIILNNEATEYFWIRAKDLDKSGLNGIWKQPIEHIKQEMLKK